MNETKSIVKEVIVEEMNSRRNDRR